MKHFPKILLGMLLICTVCLFAQSSISDDASSDRTTKEVVYFSDMLPTAPIRYSDIVQEPAFGFVSKVRTKIAQDVTLNIRLATYKGCILKWNNTNRCNIQI